MEGESMTTKDKLEILKAATRFLYSKSGPDYAFAGCGDTSAILLRVAKELRMRGVRIEFGYVYFQDGPEEGEPNAHAWLWVDGERFDPSKYAHKFKVLQYEPFDPTIHQSDLPECIVEFGRDLIGKWAEKTLEDLHRKGYVKIPHQ
jgi:hypothetical protein